MGRTKHLAEKFKMRRLAQTGREEMEERRIPEEEERKNRGKEAEAWRDQEIWLQNNYGGVPGVERQEISIAKMFCP